MGVLLLAMLLSGMLNGQTQHWQPWKIWRFWDLQVNPLEFREPVRFIPFDVKGGLAIYGGPGMLNRFPLALFSTDYSVADLDSTESEISTIGSALRRMLLIYDLDFLQINLRSKLLPFSTVDLLAGFAVRTHQVPFAPRVPNEWPSDGTSYRIAPVFHTGLVTLTVGYQRSERWYAFIKSSYGIATGSLYRADVVRRTLKGTGAAADFTLGIKRLPADDISPRMALGLELRYHKITVPKLEVPILDDGRVLSPIEGLRFRSVGIYVTFGAYFGGRESIADRAKQALYKGDYMAAAADLGRFIASNPAHTKLKRARKLLALAERMAPYQQVDLARAYQARGDLERALRWYGEAEGRADTALMADIGTGKREVGYVFLQRASDALQQNDLVATSRILRNANLLLPGEKVVVHRFEAEVLIRRGHLQRAQGDLTGALRSYANAIRIEPGRKVEIDGYRVRISEDLLRQAADAADRDAVAFAIESLELSLSLDPRRSADLDSMTAELRTRLADMTQAEIRRSVLAQMELARELRNMVPPTRPRIGMLVAALEDVLGPPDHLTQDVDATGIDHQLWEYRTGEFPGNYYFENYILKQIEAKGVP